MQKLRNPGKFGKIIMKTLTVFALVGVFILSPLNIKEVSAASAVPVNMIYYGWHDYWTAQRIISANPQSLVSNSAAGPWRSNANISQYMSAGIKYYEYLDGGYENTRTGAVPTDLWSNLSYIEAAARAGAYGIFLDQVSDGVYTAPNYYYLQQIADKAHSLGLKVVFNTGMFAWSDQLMYYCDYINSTETWSDAALTASQSKWASRTWLLTYNVYDATSAAYLTNAALSKGVNAHYACTSFGSLPYWLESYIPQITSYVYTVYTPTPAVGVPATTGQTSVTFNSTPSGAEVWLDYSYKGKTPLTLTVSPGSHHIGFNLYGYYWNIPLEGDFVAGTTAMNVTGNMQTGQVTSNSVTTATSSTQTTVNFGTNLTGTEVWVDYSYRGVAPLSLTLPAGSHSVGFYKYGYNYNQTVNRDFYLSGQAGLNIYADMLTGFTSVW